MNEGHVHPSKAILSEKEIRLINYEEEHDRLLELRKLIQEKTGDVRLEIEINDSLKNLLQSRKAHDDHFDVTIIQQQPNHLHETTVSLGINELHDFMEMVNYHNDAEDAGGGCFQQNKVLRNHMFNCPPVEGLQLAETPSSQNTEETDFTTLHNQEVYTTPYNTFEKLQKKLPCLNPNSNDKPGTPCMCQHCGMVGVLVESQKRPAIPHTPNPKVTPKAPPKRRVIDLRSKSKSETNLLLLQELSKKINSLEVRLHDYEQKTVKKDYFKYVINSMLTSYNEQINDLKNHQIKQGINISTQYSKTGHPFRDQNYEDNKKFKMWDEPERDIKYRAAKLIESFESLRLSESASEKKIERRPRSKNRAEAKPKTHDRSTSRPKQQERGADVRCRIANMLEDKVKKKQQHESHRKVERPDDVLKLPANTDDIRVDQYKSVCYGQNFKNNPFHRRKNPEGKDAELNRSADSLEELCDMVCRQYYEKKEEQGKHKHRKGNNVLPEKLLKARREEKDRPRKRSDRIDVSYFNPAAKNWEEKSTDYEGMIPEKQTPPKAKHTEEEKIEYLRMLAKDRDIDEYELWCNILLQAKEHIRSNEDTVSIQLPGGSKNRKMSELEITLTALKDIVKNMRNAKKNPSNHSMENAKQDAKRKLTCKNKMLK